MNNKLLTAQYVIPNASGIVMAGFNRKIYGETYTECFNGEPPGSSVYQGWNLAEKLIDEGKIYYTHNFHKKECVKGYAFQYGGFWRCDECRKRGVDKNWWKIRVFKDGNAWCCIGEGFENLQASNNYAFGDTKEEAISNYGDLFVVPKKAANG